MKVYLLALIISAFAPTVGFAASGQYVCQDAQAATDGTTSAANMAATLNSLSCDITKPFTATSMELSGDTYVVVCCLQK